MSGNDSPKNGPFAQAQLLNDAIVLEARAKIGKMLGTAIEALGKDIEKVLEVDAAANTEIQKAVTQITVELINLLASRVTDVLSDPPPAQRGSV